MAVVLVVLGLLIGGVMIGKSVVRSAELRAVTAEAAEYISAISYFSNKYKAMPGDFARAETLWGADAACHATPTNTTPKIATCNGNGDGYIESDFYYSTGSDYTQEAFRAWQHLANAGMISGSYTGVEGPNDPLDAEIGVNVPRSRLGGAGYTLYYVGTLAASGGYFDGAYGHAMLFGAARDSAPTTDPALSPQEALSIDNKMDDGSPAYGKILAYKSSAANAVNCTTTDVSSTSAYNATNGDRLCPLIFVTGF